MRMWKIAFGVVVCVGISAMTAPIEAAVICKKKSGVLVSRDVNCKPKETSVNLANFGAVGPTGPVGQTGPTGPAGQSALTPLPSGKTVSGVWGGSITAANAGDHYRGTASFSVPLAADIPSGNVFFVSGTSALHCPGVGQADPGFLCVYQGYTNNADTPVDFNIFDPVAGPSDSASRYGFAIYLTATASGLSSIHGAYSVTAP